MALRVVRRDEKGLYVKGHYGEKCRPVGATRAKVDDKLPCSFAAGRSSTCTNIHFPKGKIEMWVDEETVSFNADFKKRSVSCGRCGTQVLPEHMDEHEARLVLPNGNALWDGNVYLCTIHGVLRGVDMYPQAADRCAMCGAGRGQSHTKVEA